MRPNLGDLDRTARLFLGAAPAVLFLTGGVTETAGLVVAAVAVYLLGTSIGGWCPIYALLRLSTRGPNDVSAKRR